MGKGYECDVTRIYKKGAGGPIKIKVCLESSQQPARSRRCVPYQPSWDLSVSVSQCGGTSLIPAQPGPQCQVSQCAGTSLMGSGQDDWLGRASSSSWSLKSWSNLNFLSLWTESSVWPQQRHRLKGPGVPSPAQLLPRLLTSFPLRVGGTTKDLVHFRSHELNWGQVSS